MFLFYEQISNKRRICCSKLSHLKATSPWKRNNLRVKELDVSMKEKKLKLKEEKEEEEEEIEAVEVEGSHRILEF